MRCAHFSPNTLHPLRGGARLLKCMVWKIRTARISHTIHSLSLARRARLLFIVSEMHCAHVSPNTLHPVRGKAAYPSLLTPAALAFWSVWCEKCTARISH